MKKYFIQEGVDAPYKEVTKEEWVFAERCAGFHQTYGDDPNEPATGSFFYASMDFYIAGKIVEDKSSFVTP